jgi:hypothetical protein
VRSASITSMIRHYVARRAQVTEGHPHNAAERLRLHGHCWAGLDRKSSAALDWTASPVTINLNHHVLSRSGRACPDRTRTIPCKVRAVTLQGPMIRDVRGMVTVAQGMSDQVHAGRCHKFASWQRRPPKP